MTGEFPTIPDTGFRLPITQGKKPHRIHPSLLRLSLTQTEPARPEKSLSPVSLYCCPENPPALLDPGIRPGVRLTRTIRVQTASHPVSMNLLLDSNTLVWFLEGAPELSETAADLIEKRDSRSLVSSVTSWELAVKSGLGRLRLPYALGEEFSRTIESIGLEILPLSPAALARPARLPRHHRDPFDRLLIAEAFEQNASLISPNVIFDSYGVQRIW